MRAPPALAASLALACACITVGSRQEPARYYVLAAEPAASDPARPAVAVLGVGPVRLPEYLDRREIVTRVGPVRLEAASADRWAAPLDVLFASALAEDLRTALPAGEVLPWPWPVGASPEWAISVDVVRFDAEDGTAVLEARWIVRRGTAIARRGSTAARERGTAGGVEGTVVALGRTIGALARDIAAAVGDASRRGEQPAGGK
jgi:uncharacterized lipoprotein YmbA